MRGTAFKDAILPLGDEHSVRVRQFGPDQARPHVVVVAGLHGDEWHSVLALLELCRELENVEIDGRLTVVPAANSAALEERSRESSAVPGDLNRAFASVLPLDATALEEYAVRLWTQHFADADVLVDFHSGGVHDLVPHARIQADATDVVSLVAAMQYPYAMVWDPFPDGMLARVALAAGCRAFAVEEGAGHRLEMKYVSSIRDRIDRLLVACGLLPGRSIVHFEAAVIKQGVSLLAVEAGLFQPSYTVGKVIKKGAVVGRFWPLSGQAPAHLRSPAKGLILAQATAGPVEHGEPFVELVPEQS